MPLPLFALSVAVYVVGGIGSLLLGERGAVRIVAWSGGLGALAGIASSLPVLVDGETVSAVIAGPFPFAHFALRLDPLAAFMVFTISLLSAAVALFGATYVEEEYSGRGARSIAFFMNLFIASMMLVVVADNAMWFIVFFEMMSLASFFLVIVDQDKEAIGAGWIYFFIAHSGAMLVLIAFLLLFAWTGSLDFDVIRRATLPAPLASIVFLLSFAGFGAKAGMIPLHVWLPRAHPAAPSHASALMSGVMIKIGVFGIVKVGVDLLGARSLWWGLTVLAFGALSAVLGVTYALSERDLKRLLAYSSIENVGIILIGVGIAMIGLATGQPALAALGFLAAFYHLLSHAMFKGLLFLGAGAVIARAGTKDLQRMGGLAVLMPWTALACLVGVLAVSAIPPLNGFVGEWFTYQALFAAALNGSSLMRLVAPASAVILAISGGLALMCFVKAFGLAFSGRPRTEATGAATEARWPMLGGMGLLAACCVLFGIGAPAVAPAVANVAAPLAGRSIAVASGLTVFPGDAAVAQVSTPLVALLLVGLLAVPLAVTGLFAARRPGRRIGAEVWAAGYAPDPQMRTSSAGFAEPIQVLFRSLYRVRGWAEGCLVTARSWFMGVPATAGRAEQGWDRWVLLPIGRGVQAAGERMQALQGGDFRVYCLYIVAALIALLAVAVW